MINFFIADDEYYIRTSLKKNLPWKENGFNFVGEANNGKTAYEQIQILKPDIAIIDINMPGYNGIDMIEKLSASGLQCRYLILTGYNDFKYAQKSIKLNVSDYILKPIDYDLLLDSMNKIKQTIMSNRAFESNFSDLQAEHNHLVTEQYYNDLISSSLIVNNEYSNKIVKDNHITLPSFPQYGIMLFSFTDSFDQLKGWLNECSFDTNYLFHDFKKCPCQIYNSFDPGAILQNVDKLVAIASKTPYPLVVGIGNGYANLNELYLSYNESLIALKNAVFLHETIVFYKEIEKNQNIAQISNATRNRLKSDILEKNINGISSALKKQYSEFAFNKCTYHSVTLMSVQLINLLIETLSAQTNLPVSIFKQSENIIDTLSDINSIDKCGDRIISIFTSAINGIDFQSLSPDNITVQTKKFIKENYNNHDLNITLISEKLHLNYSYICSCFKRDTNITINDYTNKIRIKHATQMFDSGIKNVTYVAECCGYLTPGYFSKRFKQITGVMPSEYCNMPSHN